MVELVWKRVGTGRVVTVRCSCGVSGSACVESESARDGEGDAPYPSSVRTRTEQRAWAVFVFDARHDGCDTCEPASKRGLARAI